MAAVGICGTDLHQVKGEFRRPTPMVLGHEGAGVVEEVGDGRDASSDRATRSCSPGRRRAACAPAAVVADPRRAGSSTRRSRTARCRTARPGCRTGARPCTAARRPAASRSGSSCPSRWRCRSRAPCRSTRPRCSAAPSSRASGRCSTRRGVTPGSSVLVIGAGGVGQFVVQGARIAGATTIVVCDPVEARLEAGRRAGATHIATPDELRDVIRSELPDGADYGFDAVGDPATTATALRFTRDGGTAVIVGLPAQGLRLDLDPFELIRKEKVLTGTLYGSEDPAVSLPAMLEHVRAGRLDLASSLGPVVPARSSRRRRPGEPRRRGRPRPRPAVASGPVSP